MLLPQCHKSQLLQSHATILLSSCSSSLLYLPADPQVNSLHLLNMQHLTHSDSPPLLLVSSVSTWNSFQYLGFLVSLPSQLQRSDLLHPTSVSFFSIHTVISNDCTASIGSISSIPFSELHLLTFWAYSL